MKTSTRIKSLRLSKSMTQKELSVKTKSSIVTVQCWENGSKKPSMDAIISLARTFNVSSDYLLGIEVDCKLDSSLTMSKSEAILVNDYRRLDNYGQKLVSSVCSMELTRVQDQAKSQSNGMQIRCIPKYLTPSAAGMSSPLDGDDFEMIPVTDSVPSKADFAVRIQGDSMLPYIKDGETVYVQRTTDIRNGDVGVFAVNGSMYCKMFYQDKTGNITLVSTNPELKHTNVVVKADGDSKITCYGVVILGSKPKLPEYFPV